MKTLVTRTLFTASILLLIFTFTAETWAQEIPKPVGGISAIKSNIKYPPEAKEKGIQGKVFITATIDENGNALDIKATKSVHPLLDDAAIKAIRKTKFTPIIKSGRKVKSEVTIPVAFRLEKCKEKKS